MRKLVQIIRTHELLARSFFQIVFIYVRSAKNVWVAIVLLCKHKWNYSLWESSLHDQISQWGSIQILFDSIHNLYIYLLEVLVHLHNSNMQEDSSEADGDGGRCNHRWSSQEPDGHGECRNRFATGYDFGLKSHEEPWIAIDKQNNAASYCTSQGAQLCI